MSQAALMFFLAPLIAPFVFMPWALWRYFDQKDHPERYKDD